MKRMCRYSIGISIELIQISGLLESCRKSDERIAELGRNLNSIQAQCRKELEAAIEEAEIKVVKITSLLTFSYVESEKNATRSSLIFEPNGKWRK